VKFSPLVEDCFAWAFWAACVIAVVVGLGAALFWAIK
jgi:hypothetical protein